MSVQAMQSMLEQIKNQASQTTSINNFVTKRTASDDRSSPAFTGILADSLSTINDMQSDAKQLSEDYLKGKPGVGLNDVMVSIQKSSVALNFGIQARNKIATAYQEIMGMTV